MEIRTLKERALARRRRIIFDDDGTEIVLDGALESERLKEIAGTNVDTVYFTTRSSGFGLFSHRTAVGSMFVSREGGFSSNAMDKLLENGTDHLQKAVDFCHINGIEIFWQMRMNDTHDSSSAWYGDITFRANPLKTAHPEWLLGAKDNRPRHGGWAAVNYAVPEIRRLAYDYVREVLDNYDVDGISLDFFRHPVFFKSTANGEDATPHETALMTELLRDIRRLMDERSLAKGRALLLSVRVPDCARYAAAIGLDIEKWLTDGIVDILAASSYIRLNPWEYSADLAHKHGVLFFPSLDESRVQDKEARLARHSVQALRARALNALRAGADGILLFNFSKRDTWNFGPEHVAAYHDIGYADALNGQDKLYFASVRGVGAVAGGALPHEGYINVPVLNPGAPAKLEAGKVCAITVQMGDKMPDCADEAAKPQVTLGLRTNCVCPTEVDFNGHCLAFARKNGIWYEYGVPKSAVICGENTVRIVQTTQETAALEDLCVSVNYHE